MMDKGRLVGALSNTLTEKLAKELTSDFLEIRQDFATKTLGRASPGKFVETLIQCFQYMDEGEFDKKPNVEDYLQKRVENTKLPEGLRICGGRIARSIYALRSKRSIAHKNEIDPNTFDLAFVHQGAAWVMAELICASQ